MAATAEQAAGWIAIDGIGGRAVDFEQARIHLRVVGGTQLTMHIVAGTAFQIALTIQQKSFDGHNWRIGECRRIRGRRQHWSVLVVNKLIFAKTDHGLVIERDRVRMAQVSGLLRNRINTAQGDRVSSIRSTTRSKRVSIGVNRHRAVMAA